MKKNVEKNYSKLELKRHKESINLIASENYPSKAVLSCLNSPISLKYAEGYPDKRYYAGCSIIDEVEKEAMENCKKLFGVKYCNVQPHSGSNANLASFLALIPLGEKILAPRLDCGGHLTHGSTASYTSKLWQFEHYGLNKKNELDYDEIKKIAKQFKPKMIVAGTSAYPLKIDWQKFKEIAEDVGALLLADIAHLSGLIAGKAIESCFPFADIATSTTQKSIRGPRGGIIMTNDENIAKKIDKSVFPGLQGGPHMHTILAKSTCFKEAMNPEFRRYTKQILKNAEELHNQLKKLGIFLWTDKTETHLTNIDTIKSFGMNGTEAEKLLERNGIVVNRESIPYDTLPPWQTSGIRVGTPAVTSRGFKEKEMREIAKMIFEVLKNKKDVVKEVKKLCKKFPLL